MNGKTIPVAEPEIGEKELQLVTEAVKSGWVSSRGKFISEFEEQFARFCGTEYAIATSNGTTALHLALVSLGIGKNHEVIVPTLTFAATANAVIYTGAKPAFVDSEWETWNIDPKKIRPKITKDTKAIIPVHLLGHPAEMKQILEIAEEHDLLILEDAAEAHGATYNGHTVGSLGDAAIFSFYGNKIITTGEGGMIVTNDEKIAKEARILRDHGMSLERRYWHSVIGYNYRMTNVQAALGLAQMEKIDYFIERKRENARIYNSLLKEIPNLVLPPKRSGTKNVYWMYSILLKNKNVRDKLMEHLKTKGIDSRPFFFPVHSMPPYRRFVQKNECFSVAKNLSNRGVMLPSGVGLKKDNLEYITNEVSKVISNPLLG